MSSSGEAIRTESLSKTYGSGNRRVTVFEGLSCAVSAGERLAIVGESGAGKSTLLHLLGGLDRPTSGRIYSHGRSLTELHDEELAEFRNREIGFVWQAPSLLPEFTALENVMMPLLIRGSLPEEAARRARVKLEETGLGERLLHRTGELSGGEQQRVALARALVSEPAFLLADEPTGSLDLRTGESVISLIFALQERHRFTAIFVTHNMQLAARCDRVWELREGRLQSPSVMELQATGEEQGAARPGGGTYV